MLTDTVLRNLKPKEKAYKVTDSGGLYIFLRPKGKKVFRIDYTYNGKRKTATLDEYPRMSLIEARKALADFKIKLKQGIDPTAEKKAIEQAERAKEVNTFEVVALEWFDVKKEEWRTTHATKNIQLLQKNIFPFLGSMPIDEIKAKDVWNVLKKIEERGARDTTIRAKGVCSQIFCYGVATSRCEYDVTSGLKGVFKKPTRKNFATITNTQEIGQLLRDIDEAPKKNKRLSLFTLWAIKLIMYTLTRSQEVCKARWEEFDFTNNIWNIPSENKKEARSHTVPLSRQVLEVLEELRPHTEFTGFLFPSDRSNRGTISGESLSKAMRENLGYKDKQTIHGFRAMASTLLNEQGYDYDIIEKALAHKDKDDIRAVYNRAEYLEKRKIMLQEYADYLDELKNS